MLKDNDLTTKASLLGKRPRQLLLWGAIWSTLSCLVFAMGTVRIYHSSSGKYTGLLIALQGIIVVFMGALKLFAWKRIDFRRNHLNDNKDPFNIFHVNKLSAQVKLIAFYLVEITLLLTAASCIFSIDAGHGVYPLLKFMAPVALPNYVFGIYFIISFRRQIKRFSKMKAHPGKLYVEQIFLN